MCYITETFQTSLLARTRHLINLIVTAESSVVLLKRIEDLIDFIKQFPEAKHIAVKVKPYSVDEALYYLLIIFFRRVQLGICLKSD